MKHLLILLTIFFFSQVQLSAQVIDTVWSENWEGDWIDNWYVDGGTWEVGLPSSGPDTTYQGKNCAATVLAGNYSYSIDSRLITINKFTVPSSDKNPRMRFWHFYTFSTGDYGYLQIKTENGDWQSISPQYSHTSTSRWTYSMIDLKEFADSLIQIAFYFHSDPHASYSSGWYIDDIKVLTGQYSFNSIEGFENGMSDWSIESGTWEIGIPTSGPGTAHSGENCIGTILSGNYSYSMNTRYISPPFKVNALADNPSIRFWHWYSFSSGDYGEVHIRYYNHGSWQIISPRFTGTSSGVWTNYFSELSEYSDSIVQVAFYFYSDPHASYSSGWYIDDIKIDGKPIHDRIVIENDLAVQWKEPVSKPVCGTGKEQPIVIELTNHGERAVTNFKVGYSIDGGENYVNETVYKTIQPGDSLDYTFRHSADMADADSYNCLATVSIPYDIDPLNDTVWQMIQNDHLKVLIETTDTECNKSEGMANITSITGRQGPFDITWTSGNKGMSAEKLSAGIYFVTISDPLGCSWTKDIAINDLGAPEISLPQSSIKNISCYGLIDGSISITPVQGTPPYSYHWSNGEKTRDINWLGRGQYDVTITGADGCSKTHKFTINEPSDLKVRAISLDASCGKLTGSAAIQVTGGTKPYAYFWDSGHTTSTVTGLAGGIYNVIVKDNNWCFDSAKVSINEIDAPTLVVASIDAASCGSSDGAISITMADASYGYTYSWSDGTISKDMQNARKGYYTVTVSYDDGSCSTNEIIEIPEKAPDPGTICMITVDSISGGNIVILKDMENPDAISSYNVYKLSKTGTYQYYDSADPAATNTTEDVASNMEITSYRYRVTLVDDCGNESEPSPFHETMHTVVAPDFSLTRANLFWNAYKGIDYSSFQIYRYSGLRGLEIIDTVPNVPDKNFYTYTDLNPPLNDTLFYVIAIELDDPCNSTKKAGTHNTVRSNKSKKLKFGDGTFTDNPGSVRHLSIFPNPNQGSFKVRMDLINNQDVILKIYDTQGRMIKNLKYNDLIGSHEELVELNIGPGLYYLQVLANDGITCKPFVVQ